MSEPAMLLSAPGGGEDGILTAKEAARLRLNADWILLSGVTLLRATATMRTVSQVLHERSSSLAHNSSGSKAEAVRATMLDLKSRDEFDHPFFWAPFELIGASCCARLGTTRLI